MEKIINHNLKCVEIWLTKTESCDEVIQKSLMSFYSSDRADKYRVVVFESGSGSLLKNTQELLRNTIESEARRQNR